MQNSALNIASVQAVATPRETQSVLLSPSLKAPEIIQSPEERDFIFTRHYSPTSD